MSRRGPQQTDSPKQIRTVSRYWTPFPGKAVGLFTREDAFRARLFWFKDENVRERHLSVAAWLAGLPKRAGKGSGATS